MAEMKWTEGAAAGHRRQGKEPAGVGSGGQRKDGGAGGADRPHGDGPGPSGGHRPAFGHDFYQCSGGRDAGADRGRPGKAAGGGAGDRNLERQTSLIHHARITTIDSFCLKLLREHFNELDIDPGFRIGDEGELLLLQADVMKELLEDYYGREDGRFLRFVDTYASGKADGGLEDYILQVWRFSQSNPGRASGSPPVKKSFQRRQTGIWTDWRSQNGCGFWCRM